MGLLSKQRNNGASAIISTLTDKAKNNLPWEESTWGSDDVNCYAWAANCESPASAKPDPGQFSGRSSKASGKFTASLLIEGAKADGLAYGANAPENKPLDVLHGYYTVALYMSKNGADHHWYRRDPQTGLWTHKPGPQGIRNYGPNFVIMPKQLPEANHNYGSASTNYQFVAYFYVPVEGLQV